MEKRFCTVTLKRRPQVFERNVVPALLHPIRDAADGVFKIGQQKEIEPDVIACCASSLKMLRVSPPAKCRFQHKVAPILDELLIIEARARRMAVVGLELADELVAALSAREIAEFRDEWRKNTEVTDKALTNHLERIAVLEQVAGVSRE